MAERTGIEWTDATWNPVTGCARVSSGCDHCYAASLAERRLRAVYLKRDPVVDTPTNRADPFAVRLWPERLGQPALWRDPRVVFVNSMSDLFHVDVPEPYIREVFEIMLAVDRHIYQVLTKRPLEGATVLAAARGPIRQRAHTGAHLDRNVDREPGRRVPSRPGARR